MGEKRTRQEHGDWKSLEYTMQQAKAIMEEYGFERLPSSNKLYELGCSALEHAIIRYHGGFRKFRELLGEEKIIRERGIWKSLEYTMQQAKAIMEEHGFGRLPSQQKINELGYSALTNAIGHYHEGLTKFRELLGEEKIRRERGVWQSLEYTMQQAKAIMEEHGFGRLPSQQKFNELGYGALAHAIFRYHGGFTRFRELLGEEKIRRERGVWQSLEYTMQQARAIMEEHGFERLPSSNKLYELGCGALAHAIFRYHRGFNRFRELLGEEKIRREIGVWQSLEYTMQQAKAIMEEHGFGRLPSQQKFNELGYGALVSAIGRYHGGFTRFRELLGEEPKQVIINSQEQLQEFLEEEPIAKEIASLTAINGYTSDVAGIMIQLWPERFPSIIELERSLPRAVRKMGRAITPFTLSDYERIYDRFPSLPDNVRTNMDELLYRIMCDSYQKRFNQDPVSTMDEIRRLTLNRKIKPLASRVLEYYREVFTFNVPGFGSIAELYEK